MAGINRDERILLPKLKGKENYEIWASKVMLACDDDDCTDVITGDVTKPDVLQPQVDDESDSDYKERKDVYDVDMKNWTKMNKKARAKIALYVDDVPYSHICGMTNAVDMWNKLKSLYSAVDPAIPSRILREMHRTTLADSNNADAYIASLRDKWTRIRDMGKDIAEWIVIGILMDNLTPAYDNWCELRYEKMRDKDVTFDEIAEDLIRYESILKDAANANIVRGRPQQDKDKKKDRKDKSDDKNRRSPKGEEECYGCKNAGRQYHHWYRKCYYKHPEQRPNK